MGDDYVVGYCEKCERDIKQSQFPDDADASECPVCGELLYTAEDEE